MREAQNYSLYTVRTIIPEFHGCKNVDVLWFYWDRRDSPPAPYADVIDGYDPSSELRGMAESAIDNKFTKDEAEQLCAWLAANRGGNHQIEQADLPIETSVIGIGAAPVGGPQDFIMLGRTTRRWTLPFSVGGYFDLRGHEAMPYGEADPELQSAIESIIESRDWQRLIEILHARRSG